ncbi:MAG: diaminopimelate epimerase [Planctomycetota bacterium]
MEFIKMQGTGNDFIMINALQSKVVLPPSLVRKLCDRKQGVRAPGQRIGADGIIMVLPPDHKRSNFRMRIFNSDASEAEMCGNGIRCFGKLVYESRLTKRKNLLVDTKGGLMRVSLHIVGNKANNVTVLMPKPRRTEDYSDKKLPIPVGANDITSVSLSNPHCVLFLKSINRLPIAKYGPVIERHRLFPNRTNVEFIQVLSRNRIKMRVWERGVGETLACGTGACAAVVAGIFRKKLNNSVKVELKGGALHIRYISGKGIYLTGGAEVSYKGAY